MCTLNHQFKTIACLILGQVETDEAESRNRNRKRKTEAKSWNGQLMSGNGRQKPMPWPARGCDNCSKLVLTGGKMEVRGSESVLILDPLLFVVAFHP